ncbi:MAG: hypothetical protein WCO26_20285, partial [Deltaproteobacteria bacterium]
SCADAIGKAIDWHLQGKKEVPAGNYPEMEINTPETNLMRKTSPPRNESSSIFLRGACPECGGPLFFEEGCAKCVCGYSDCG